MARSNLTNEDKGKRVVNSSGDKIGVVSDVEGNAAHVNPEAGLSDSIRSKLGWDDSQDSKQMLPSDRIQEVTDDEVKLKD